VVILQEFDTPAKHTLVFNGNLLARVTEVMDTNFDFWVLNGAWSGTFASYDQTILVHETQSIFDSPAFEQVVKMTPSEIDRWYLVSPTDREPPEFVKDDSNDY
jgi:hypothetical protein